LECCAVVAVDVDVTRGRPELSETRWKFHNFPLDFVLGSESCLIGGKRKQTFLDSLNGFILSFRLSKGDRATGSVLMRNTVLLAILRPGFLNAARLLEFHPGFSLPIECPSGEW
jgi:hypothetical protein